MNQSHKTNRKINRVKRLVRRLKDAPLDAMKGNRKKELAAELNKMGIKI